MSIWEIYTGTGTSALWNGVSYLVRGNALITFDFRVPTMSLPFPISPGAVAVNRVSLSSPEWITHLPGESGGRAPVIASFW